MNLFQITLSVFAEEHAGGPNEPRRRIVRLQPDSCVKFCWPLSMEAGER